MKYLFQLCAFFLVLRISLGEREKGQNENISLNRSISLIQSPSNQNIVKLVLTQEQKRNQNTIHKKNKNIKHGKMIQEKSMEKLDAIPNFYDDIVEKEVSKSFEGENNLNENNLDIISENIPEQLQENNEKKVKTIVKEKLRKIKKVKKQVQNKKRQEKEYPNDESYSQTPIVSSQMYVGEQDKMIKEKNNKKELTKTKKQSFNNQLNIENEVQHVKKTVDVMSLFKKENQILLHYQDKILEKLAKIQKEPKKINLIKMNKHKEIDQQESNNMEQEQMPEEQVQEDQELVAEEEQNPVEQIETINKRFKLKKYKRQKKN